MLACSTKPMHSSASRMQKSLKLLKAYANCLIIGRGESEINAVICTMLCTEKKPHMAKTTVLCQLLLSNTSLNKRWQSE